MVGKSKKLGSKHLNTINVPLNDNDRKTLYDLFEEI
jgi:hypothetical protein